MSGYIGYRKVPRKLVIVGDVNTGKKFLGEADSQLRILEQQMTFQGLKQGYRTIKPCSKVIISCWSCFSIQGVVISIKGGKKLPEEILRECWCNCNFSIGQVIELTGGLGGETVEELDTYSIKTYSVKACNRKEIYLLYENVIASDFTVYTSGQVVILMAYKDKNFLCHLNEEVAFGCDPIAPEEVISNSAWRTAYRIIPVCPELFHKWTVIK